MSLAPRRLLSLSALVLSLAVPLAACSSSGAGGTASGGTPKDGGTLTFALAADPQCVDPQQAAQNASLNVGRQIVDSLTVQNPRTSVIEPWLATTWQVNATSTLFTFHLRPGVTFSDGTPVNAAAVKANFDAIVKLGAKALLGASYLAGYTGSTVVDDHTVAVAFGRPNAQFLQATSTMSLGLLATSTLAESPGTRCLGTGLIGSGPFVLTGYQPNQSVTLGKREGYDWGPTGAAHTGPAYLNGIKFEIIAEQGTRTGSLQSGQVDAISDLPPQDESTFRAQGYTILTRANPGIPFTFAANTSHPIVSDLKVRQAISEGIDRAQVVSTVLSPGYKVATSALASTTPDYTDLSSDLAYDPQAAKQLLASDGWQVGSDGIRVKNGTRLALNVIYVNNFNSNGTVLELIQQQLKAIGVQLNLRLLTAAQAIAASASGDYDLTWYNLTRSDPDVLRTSYSVRGGNRLFLKTAGPLETALEGEASTLDATARQRLVTTAQQLLITNAYEIPVFELAQVHALSSRVHGLEFEASSRLSFYDTWLS
jgi:peptide/nickel transport system substrate-binding protein